MGVPIPLVPLQKDIDYDTELMAAWGIPFQAGGRLIPPPSIGVFGLLEIIDSRWFKARRECSILDLYKVAYVCFHREECAPEIWKWAREKGRENVVDIENFDTFKPWDIKVWKWATEQDSYGDFRLDHDRLTNGDFDNFLLMYKSGYDRLNQSDSGEEKIYVFGADTQISIAKMLCETLNVNLFDALWRVSLCAAGMAAMAQSKSNGGKINGRPVDAEILGKMKAQCRERDEKGELHFWQITNPGKWPPTTEQAIKNPKVFEQFDEQRKWYVEVGHEAAMAKWKADGINYI